MSQGDTSSSLISQNELFGVYQAPGINVHSTVRIGPSAVILGPDNNSKPQTVIEEYVEIGANSIGIHAHIHPGSVVARSVPPFAIVQGNPAQIIGYVEKTEAQCVDQKMMSRAIIPCRTRQSNVNGVVIHHFNVIPDLRGSLSVAEFEREIPFIPKRYFLVYDVPTAETRGEHAHLQCEQFLIAVKGSVSVVVDDGSQRDEIILSQPQTGIYLPPMTWGVQYNYTSDAILLVFASEYYDPADYIRNYSEFLRITKRAA